jgi:hypothetical protein
MISHNSGGSGYCLEVAQVVNEFVKNNTQSGTKDYDHAEEQSNHEQLPFFIEKLTATVQAT